MGLFKLGGLAMVFIFVGMVLGMFIAGGGEIEGAPVLDDPSREQVDGEWITAVELRDDGVYVITSVTGFAAEMNLYVTLPAGETHSMSRLNARDQDIDDPDVYSYEMSSPPSGNYTVEKRSLDASMQNEEVDESHTVYLKPHTK